MAEILIRIGKVSSRNEANGTIRVTYPDMDDSVTAEIPVFAFTDEYKMPPIGAEVLVLHLSNGSEAGVMMGRYWNKSHKPPVTSGFRKELGENQGDAFIEYNGSAVKIHAAKIILDGDVETDGSITVPANDDVTVGEISLKDHKHTDSMNGTTAKPVT